jgi:signal transduction histidine kinase
VQIQLAHANRVATMGQLSASITHEVNQPITAAVTYALAARRWLSAEPPNFHVKGKLAIDCDETEYGIALLRNMLKTIHEHYYLLVPTVTGALAEGLRRAGQLEEARFSPSMTPLPVRGVME